MNNEKIMKSAKTIDRCLKVIQGFMIAFGIVCAVFIPLLLIPGINVIADTGSFTLGSLELQTVTSCMNTDGARSLLIPMLVLYIVLFAVGWYYLKVMREVFAPLKEGTPFADGISAKIRRLAWLTFIGGGVLEIVKAVNGLLELKMYDLSQIFNSDVVAGYAFNIDIDAGFVILAVVLFLLSYVFRCGEVLQKESDETL